MTDFATGVASCTIIPTEAAGPFTVAAGFAGDGNYLASAASQPFTVTREETSVTYTGPTVIAQGHPVTLAGRLLEDGTVPIAGRTLTLTIGTGVSAQTCVTGPTDAAGTANCTVPTVTVGQGPEAVGVSFAGDAYYLPSTAAASVIVFAFPSRGVFVLGNQTVSAAPSTVTFWGAQWAGSNSVTGGAPSSSGKGFADRLSLPQRRLACGGTWSTSPGNSSSPVDTVPAYMARGRLRARSRRAAARSPATSFTSSSLLTNLGYGSDPGHAGTGTIVATYC